MIEEFPVPETSLPQLYPEITTGDYAPPSERGVSYPEFHSERREGSTPKINSPDNPAFKRFMLSLSSNARDRYEDEVAKRIFDSHSKVNSD